MPDDASFGDAVDPVMHRLTFCLWLRGHALSVIVRSAWRGGPSRPRPVTSFAPGVAIASLRPQRVS